jgi:heterodisulfide reductase subunit B2
MTVAVSYYPGCSLDGTAREYGESVEAAARLLGVELRELEDWTCCGASSAHANNDGLAVALPASNLMRADKAGLDLVVPCAACFERLKVAEKALKSGKDIAGISGKYDGKFNVKHMVDFIWDDVGEKSIKEKVKKPLSGLKTVCYYGCLITRPPKVTGAINPENPQAMDHLMKSLGADVRDWSYKTNCCGGSLMITCPDIARKMTTKLLDMAAEAGADCIVAGCPICQSNLDNYQSEISLDTKRKYEVPIFYFTELIGLALGDPSAKKWLSRHMVDPRPLLERKGLI